MECIRTCINAVQHGLESWVVATLGLVQEQTHLLHLGHAQLEESLCHNAVLCSSVIDISANGIS